MIFQSEAAECGLACIAMVANQHGHQLASQGIRPYGNSVPLQSGMLLSADIVLEQRSLLAWLFEPILSLKGRL